MTAHTIIPTEPVQHRHHGRAMGTERVPTKRLPKRGDLAVLVQLSRIARIGAPAEESLSVRIGIVTSVTRAGEIARAWFPGFATSELDPERAERSERMNGTLHYVAAERVDIPAILAEYQSRRYPTAPDSDMVPPFSDNSDARALIVKHRRAE